MNTTRKKFLQQSALALLSTSIPFAKLFSRDEVALRSTLDTYHPVDCSIDLATEYKYTYIPNSESSQIAVLDGYYSYPNPPDNSVNPFSDDVLYKLEGQPPDIGACDPEPTSNQCNNVDFDPFNPPTYLGTNPFRYKAYYPKETIHDYVNRPLPVFIFFHAGGFQECPAYTLPLIKNLCIELSQKGFICFTVEYRRGRILDTDTSKTSVQQQFARYRAIQDGCGAIRSIIKKNRTGDAQKFPFIIDENQVFAGGTSAGGIIALGCSYYRTSSDLVTDQSMTDSVFPKLAGSTYEIKQVLGKMHADYYYAPPDPTYWPKIVGVVSLWGGIVIPKSFDGAMNESDLAAIEANFFKQGSPGTYDNPPLICFHGGLDPTIPFNDDASQDIDLSPQILGASPDFNAESFCTSSGNTFAQKSVVGIELKLCSSLNMFLVMRQLNRFSEFYLDCSMAHGLDEDCVTCGGTTANKYKNTCTPCVYTSNFGTASTNQQQTTVYMAQRIAIFTQAIMANYPSVLLFGAKGRNYFKDCENSRKCSQINNNACGAGNTLCNGNTLF